MTNVRSSHDPHRCRTLVVGQRRDLRPGLGTRDVNDSCWGQRRPLARTKMDTTHSARITHGCQSGGNAVTPWTRGRNAAFRRPLSGCQESERVLHLVLTLQMNSSLAEEAGGDECADMVKQTKTTSQKTSFINLANTKASG